jgi:hypothetical protein
MSVSLPLFGGWGGQRQVFTFSQTPDSEPDYVNHAESELFLQLCNKLKVRVCKTNRSGLKLFAFHCCPFLQVTILDVIAVQQ